MDFYIIAIFVLFGSIIGSRLINEKGVKKLNENDKVRLTDALAGIKKYQLIPVIALIAGYFIASKYFPQNMREIFVVYFALLALVIALINYIAYHKLKKIGIPEDYLKTYILSETIKTAGMIVCFALLIFSYPNQY